MTKGQEVRQRNANTAAKKSQEKAIQRQQSLARQISMKTKNTEMEKLAASEKHRKTLETSYQKVQEKMQQGQNNMNFRYALETLSNKIKLSKVQEKIMASTIRQLEKEELLYFKN